jgi:hypothetical protein
MRNIDRLSHFFTGVVLALLLVIIFRQQLFSSHTFASGDWPYFFPQAAKELPLTVIYYKGYIGLGQGSILFTGLETLFHWGARLTAPFGWRFFESAIWFIPLIFLASLASFILTQSFLGTLIYTLNTYFLMLIGGGQFGVALAYAVAPLVFVSFAKLIAQGRQDFIYLSGIALAVQIFFDPRLAFLTVICVFLYLFFAAFFFQKKCLKVLFSSLIKSSLSLVVALLLNAFWLIPFVAFGVGPQEHGNVSDFSAYSVKFLSFSDFSHAFSLLHPNWPENIFGKVYFMQSEFLILPILAYSSLISLKKRLSSDDSTTKILFFALLGIIGAFLAKGTALPFGGVYLFLYKYMPGFVVFRDPTKFYLLIALAYSVLIPYSLVQLAKWTNEKLELKNEKMQARIKLIFFIFFFLFFMLLIRPALYGELGGTFKPIGVPDEYRRFAHFLGQDESFSRVLWIPKHQRFGYYSLAHPALSAELLFGESSPSAILQTLEKPATISLLQEASVRYLVVPTDPQSEIFLVDRKYDDSLRKEFIARLDTNKALTRLFRDDQLAVYKLEGFKDHVWLSHQSTGQITQWKQISPTEYRIDLKNISVKDKLVFSENFSRLWQLRVGEIKISPSPYRLKFMQFMLPKEGSYQATLIYTPSLLMLPSLLVSFFALLVIFSLWAGHKFRLFKKRERG